MKKSGTFHKQRWPAPGWSRNCFRVALLLSGGYLAIVLVFFLLQSSLIFPAPRYPVGDWEVVHRTDWIDEIEFESEDGCKLVGWLAKSNAQRGIALFHHGNGENIAFMHSELKMLTRRFGLTVFVYDYRGYGKSDGAPSEKGLMMDGRAAMRTLNELTKSDPQDVIVFGRSLGGAIACEVASTQGARALVLQSTFDSLENVAVQSYRWLPVRMLLKFPLRSEARIRNFEGPLLQCHGTRDSIVPIANARRLFEACPSHSKIFVELDARGHNDVLSESYLKQLEPFFASLPR